MSRSNRIAIKATTLFLFALLLLSCAFCSDQQPGFFDIFYRIRVEEDSHYFTLRFVQMNDRTTPEAEHELDLSQDLSSPSGLRRGRVRHVQPVQPQAHVHLHAEPEQRIICRQVHRQCSKCREPYSYHQLHRKRCQRCGIPGERYLRHPGPGLYTSTIYVHIVTDFP